MRNRIKRVPSVPDPRPLVPEEAPVATQRRHPVLLAALAGLAVAIGSRSGTAPSSSPFAAVSTRGDHTCGVTAAGAAYCWGSNTYGQLGDGTTTDRLTPVLVAAPAGVSFVAVSAGAGHTCGITAAGVAYCWGRTSFGNLDGGAASTQSTPRLVAAPTGVRFAALSAGVLQNCGLTAAGA